MATASPSSSLPRRRERLRSSAVKLEETSTTVCPAATRSRARAVRNLCCLPPPPWSRPGPGSHVGSCPQLGGRGADLASVHEGGRARRRLRRHGFDYAGRYRSRGCHGVPSGRGSRPGGFRTLLSSGCSRRYQVTQTTREVPRRLAPNRVGPLVWVDRKIPGHPRHLDEPRSASHRAASAKRNTQEDAHDVRCAGEISWFDPFRWGWSDQIFFQCATGNEHAKDRRSSGVFESWIIHRVGTGGRAWWRSCRAGSGHARAYVLGGRRSCGRRRRPFRARSRAGCGSDDTQVAHAGRRCHAAPAEHATRTRALRPSWASEMTSCTSVQAAWLRAERKNVRSRTPRPRWQSPTSKPRTPRVAVGSTETAAATTTAWANDHAPVHLRLSRRSRPQGRRTGRRRSSSERPRKAATSSSRSPAQIRETLLWRCPVPTAGEFL